MERKHSGSTALPLFRSSRLFLRDDYALRLESSRTPLHFRAVVLPVYFVFLRIRRVWVYQTLKCMDLKLPKLGEGAESGTVVSILVKEGDRIEQGQTILELENEKAVAPIPAPVSGTITKLRVKEGDTISIGHVIATLLEGEATAPAAKVVKKAEATPPTEGEEAASEEEKIAEEPEEETEQPQMAAPGLAPVASPSIRKMARELGIDLKWVRGSERGGRIVLADLRAYIQRLQRLALQPKPAAAEKAGTPAPVSIDFAKWGEVTKKPMSQLRKTISRRLWESWNAIPHVTQFDEADITVLNELRKKYAPAYEQRGTKLTLTSFALKAAAAALNKHPIFNASLDEATQDIVFKQYCHIGLAVDTEQGLIVPVIRDVNKRDLLELSRAVHELAEKARARKLSLEEMQGGTFTISNQGGIGGAHFTPIVNRPEVAILGLGRGALKAVVKNGKLEQRLMLPIAISYDHRVIDGGSAARFAVDLVQAFEDFKEEDVKV
jgi:pyruvate dehydrogenase E2 component (dihydrolipoamide acetyltransferase)